MEVTLFVKLCSHCRVSSARRTLSRRTQSRSLDHQEYLKVNPVVRTCDVILVPRAAILLASATDRELWPRLPRLFSRKSSFCSSSGDYCSPSLFSGAKINIQSVSTSALTNIEAARPLKVCFVSLFLTSINYGLSAPGLSALNGSSAPGLIWCKFCCVSLSIDRDRTRFVC